MKSTIKKAIDALEEIKKANPQTLNLGRQKSLDDCLANLSSMHSDTPDDEKKPVAKKTETAPKPETAPKTESKAGKSAEDRLSQK